MKQVYGKPFVCLDEWCDIPRLKQLIPDINRGLGLSHGSIRMNYGVENHDMTDKDDIRGAMNRLAEAETDPTILAHGKELKEKDPVAYAHFLMYQYPCYEALTYCVLREPDVDINDPCVPMDAVKRRNIPMRWTPESDNFKSLKGWLMELPYETLGPVILLLKLSGAPTIRHRDFFLQESGYEHEEQFIWFDPCESRHLYVEQDGVKMNMEPGTAFYWNHHDWHGGQERTHHVSWALRTEGVFNSELQKAIESQPGTHLRKD